MRLRIKFRLGSGDSAEPQLFSDVFVRRRTGWAGLLASAAAHGLVLVLLPTLVDALSALGGDAHPEWAAYTPEMLRLELPDHLYLPAVRPLPKQRSRAEKQAGPRQRVRQPAGHAPPARTPPPRQLELPITQHPSDQASVILQPDAPALPAPHAPALSPMAFWNQAVPRPDRRRFIPGRVQAPSASPRLEAPPVLAPSNPQPVSSDVSSALAALQTKPKLPLPNSSTNPLRIHGTGAPEIASFDAPQSDPLNLISLTANNDAKRLVEIPRGLRSIPRSAAGAGSEVAAPESAAATRVPEPPDAPSDAPTAPPRAVADPASAGPSRPNNTAPAGPAPASSPPGNSPAAQRKTAVPVAQAAAPAADPPRNAAGAVIRTTHPSNGNFDVVILQSIGGDDLPDVTASLSGNPVYTVYLKVGDERDWLLEYCIPARANSRFSSFQVNIDDPGVVTAPYPLSTAIPRDIVESPHPQRIVLHGLLNAAGVLRDVTAADAGNPLIREVVSLLGQWQFRPASRDKIPVEVEILLIIPARS